MHRPLLLWSVGVMGCTSPQLYLPTPPASAMNEVGRMEVDEPLKPYVALFIADMDKYGCSKSNLYRISHISYRSQKWMERKAKAVGHSAGVMIGVCILPKDIASSDSRQVYIRDNTRLTPLDHMLLMYHELGHCALNLDHVEDSEGTMAAMLPWFDEQTTMNKWEAMKDKLFAGCKRGTRK